MTDIDALITKIRDRASSEYGTDHEWFLEIADALTAERAKVAALEKENAKFRTMLGGSTALAEGLGIRTDAIMQEVALAAYKQLEEAKADAATERAKVEALEADVKFWQERVHRAALTAYTAAREEPHDKG